MYLCVRYFQLYPYLKILSYHDEQTLI